MSSGFASWAVRRSGSRPSSRSASACVCLALIIPSISTLLTSFPCYPVRGAAGGECVCVRVCVGGDLSVTGRRLIVVELFSHANAAAGETQTQIHRRFPFEAHRFIFGQ